MEDMEKKYSNLLSLSDQLNEELQEKNAELQNKNNELREKAESIMVLEDTCQRQQSSSLGSERRLSLEQEEIITLRSDLKNSMANLERERKVNQEKVSERKRIELNHENMQRELWKALAALATEQQKYIELEMKLNQALDSLERMTNKMEAAQNVSGSIDFTLDYCFWGELSCRRLCEKKSRTEKVGHLIAMAYCWVLSWAHSFCIAC